LKHDGEGIVLFGKMLILVCLILAIESITCHMAESNIGTGRNGA
jgi:hypothetical protein